MVIDKRKFFLAKRAQHILTLPVEEQKVRLQEAPSEYRTALLITMKSVKQQAPR